jgi:hypothetical protein
MKKVQSVTMVRKPAIIITAPVNVVLVLVVMVAILVVKNGKYTLI